MTSTLPENDFYLLDTLNIGILILNHEGNVIFGNEWFKGRLPPGLWKIGISITSLGALSERSQKAIDEARLKGLTSFLSGKLNELPFKLISNGSTLSYNMIVSRVFLNGKSVRHVIIQIVDVTQVKQREAFLIEKQREIDKERENTFNKSRLVSLGELSSSIAHEINNPLAILNLNFKILEKTLSQTGSINDTISELLNTGSATIERISRLIVGIKNLARNPQGEEFEDLLLMTILDDILPIIEARANAEGIEIRISNSKEVFNTPFPCIRTLMGQLFVNMLYNSIYEMKKYDSKWIEIKSEIDKNSLKITITDSGQGIPLEIQDKIFLPFYTTKDIGEGTGLGLSMIIKVLNAHKGSIAIDNSNPNTSFIITLPLKK